MKTNTELTVYYKAEANYGGGDAGAEGAKTHAAATTGYAAFNYLAGDVKLGGIKFKRSRLKAPGIGLGKGLVVTTGAEFPDVEISYYLQGADTVWGALAVGGTEGTAGTSYTFNVVVPDPDESGTTETWTVFGAQLKSYKVEGSIDNDKPPYITLTFSCYDVVQDPTPVDFSAIAIPVTTVQEWEDFSYKVDTVPITQMKTFTFTLINEYVEVGSGKNSSWGKFKLLLKDKKLEYSMTFYKEEGVIVEDVMLSTINQDTALELATGVDTYTITNCYMDESNFPEYKGDDIAEVEYTVKYVNGNSVFART